MDRQASDINLLGPDTSSEYRLDIACQLCALAVGPFGSRDWKQTYPSSWRAKVEEISGPETTSSKAELVLLSNQFERTLIVALRNVEVNQNPKEVAVKKPWPETDQKGVAVPSVLLEWYKVLKERLQTVVGALNEDSPVETAYVTGAGWSGSLAHLCGLAVKELLPRALAVSVHSFGAPPTATDKMVVFYESRLPKTWRHCLSTDVAKLQGTKQFKPVGNLVVLSSEGLWLKPETAKIKAMSKSAKSSGTGVGSEIRAKAYFDYLTAARAAGYVCDFEAQSVNLAAITLAWRVTDVNKCLPQVNYIVEMRKAQGGGAMQAVEEGLLAYTKEQSLITRDVEPGVPYEFQIRCGAPNLAEEGLLAAATPTGDPGELELCWITEEGAIVRFSKVNGAVSYRLSMLTLNSRQAGRPEIIDDDLTTGVMKSEVGIDYLRSIRGQVSRESVLNEITHEIENLEAGTDYELRMYPKTAFGFSEEIYASKFITTVPRLEQPPRAVGVTEESITVEWDSTQGAASYQVKARLAGPQSDDDDWIDVTVDLDASQLRATVHGLEANTPYSVWVFAENPSGVEKEGMCVEAVHTLKAITGLQIRDNEEGLVKVVWDKHRTAEVFRLHFTLHDDEPEYQETKVEFLGGPQFVKVHSFETTALQSGTQMDLTIFAGVGDIYETVGGAIEITTVMAPPSDVLVSSLSADACELQWSPVPGATRYELKYRDHRKEWQTMDEIHDSHVKVGHLEPAFTYKMELRALRGHVRSEAVPDLFVTPVDSVVNGNAIRWWGSHTFMVRSGGRGVSGTI